MEINITKSIRRNTMIASNNPQFSTNHMDATQDHARKCVSRWFALRGGAARGIAVVIANFWGPFQITFQINKSIQLKLADILMTELSYLTYPWRLKSFIIEESCKAKPTVRGIVLVRKLSTISPMVNVVTSVRPFCLTIFRLCFLHTFRPVPWTESNVLVRSS